MTDARSIDCPVVDIDPYGESFLADPFPWLAELRELGPVCHLSRYGAWAVARHAEVQAVLKDHEQFSSAAGVGLANVARDGAWRRPSILLEVDPPLHTKNRSVVARALSPRSLRSLQETFDRRAEELVAGLLEREVIDAVADLAEVFPTQVFPEVFGLRAGGKEYLLRYGAMVFNSNGAMNELFERSVAGAEEVLGWITAQCRRHALAPGGIGAAIYEGVDLGEVTEEEAGLLVRSFLSAGVDTTVSALALGILDFVRFPDQWQALRADPGLARNAFEEIVRFESPVVGFFRTTTAEVELAGARLPAEAKVLVFFAGANRDPRRWERPDELDITRRTVGHAGFGVGVHNCVGQVIARMEGEAILGALARQVSSLELVGQPELRLNNTLRGLQHLPVRLWPA
jgi:cytochrome P450